jgi:hypothetical protein
MARRDPTSLGQLPLELDHLLATDDPAPTQYLLNGLTRFLADSCPGKRNTTHSRRMLLRPWAIRDVRNDVHSPAVLLEPTVGRNGS